jgi:hypothetical protein
MRCAAKRMVLVSDLRRSRGSYALAWIGGRLAGSRVARADALLSVRAAWTMEEWPARFLLVWERG